MADGIRFPDEMVQDTEIESGDKLLISDKSDSKKAKWINFDELQEWIKTISTTLSGDNLSEANIAAWQSVLDIAWQKSALQDATEKDVQTLTSNGVYKTNSLSENLPTGVSGAGVLILANRTDSRHLLYLSANRMFVCTYDGSDWSDWTEFASTTYFDYKYDKSGGPVSGMLEFTPQTLSSANTLTLTYNYVILSDCLNELQRINYSFTQSPIIAMSVKSGQVIRHGLDVSDDAHGIWLSTEDDWTAESNITIFFLYNPNTGFWEDASGIAKLSESVSTLLPVAELRNSSAYDFQETCYITGFPSGTLDNCTVTNEADSNADIATTDIATIEIEDGKIKITPGTTAGYAYGIKVYDTDGSLVYEFPLCENNADSPLLHCTVTGAVMFCTGTKNTVTQSTYHKCNENGFTYLVFSDDSILFVPYTNEKTKIYNNNNN